MKLKGWAILEKMQQYNQCNISYIYMRVAAQSLFLPVDKYESYHRLWCTPKVKNHQKITETRFWDHISSERGRAGELTWDLPPSWWDSAHSCDTALPQPHHPCRSVLQLYKMISSTSTSLGDKFNTPLVESAWRNITIHIQTPSYLVLSLRKILSLSYLGLQVTVLQ